MQQTLAVLKLSKRLNDIVAFARSVAEALATHPTSFPTPSPPLATFQADIDALAAAQVSVLTRAKGTAEERDVLLQVVRADLRRVQLYVQEIADRTPRELAAAIIEDAGLFVRRVNLPDKPTLEVTRGRVSGAVRVVARAVAPRAAYEWQLKKEGDGPWAKLPSTLATKTTAAGLTPGDVWLFRVRALTSAGMGDWSQEVGVRVV